jgi:hypothetical protein
MSKRPVVTFIVSELFVELYKVASKVQEKIPLLKS